MPARCRAPPGCGPQARWLCCSLLTYHPGYARRSRLASGPAAKCKRYSLKDPKERLSLAGLRHSSHPEWSVAQVVATALPGIALGLLYGATGSLVAVMTRWFERV